MAILEGNLFGGCTQRPSTMVLYIMARVNLGLDEGFCIEWASIVGNTPWLATRQHANEQELQQFYNEPALDMPSELELATEDVWHCIMEEAAWMDSGNQSVAPSWAAEA